MDSDCPFGIFKLCLSSAVLFSFMEGLTCLIDFEIGLSTINVFLFKLFFGFTLLNLGTEVLTAEEDLVVFCFLNN